MSRPEAVPVAASPPASRDPLFASSGGGTCPSPSESSGGCIAGLTIPVTDYASGSKPETKAFAPRSPIVFPRASVCARCSPPPSPPAAMHRSRHDTLRIAAAARTRRRAASRQRRSRRGRGRAQRPAGSSRRRAPAICPRGRACATLPRGTLGMTPLARCTRPATRQSSPVRSSDRDAIRNQGLQPAVLRTLRTSERVPFAKARGLHRSRHPAGPASARGASRARSPVDAVHRDRRGSAGRVRPARDRQGAGGSQGVTLPLPPFAAPIPVAP